MPRLSPSFILSAAALLMGTTSVAAQATHIVELSGTRFTPNTLTVNQGDTVQWNWISGTHNVVSYDGYFNSGAPTGGSHSFSITFDGAFLAVSPSNGNVYEYFCAPHESAGMLGEITVATVNPVLTISNFNAGQTSQMTVTEAGFGALIGFAYSLTSAGPTTLNAGPCGSVTTLLSNPITLLPQAFADAAGNASIPANLPAGTTGISVWVQAMDISNCMLSNGVFMVIG